MRRRARRTRSCRRTSGPVTRDVPIAAADRAEVEAAAIGLDSGHRLLRLEQHPAGSVAHERAPGASPRPRRLGRQLAAGHRNARLPPCGFIASQGPRRGGSPESSLPILRGPSPFTRSAGAVHSFFKPPLDAALEMSVRATRRRSHHGRDRASCGHQVVDIIVKGAYVPDTVVVRAGTPVQIARSHAAQCREICQLRRWRKAAVRRRVWFPLDAYGRLTGRPWPRSRARS